MGDFTDDSARVQEAMYSKVRLSGRGLVSMNFEQLLYSFKPSRFFLEGFVNLASLHYVTFDHNSDRNLICHFPNLTLMQSLN